MFRNYLAATLRNLSRHRLHSAITLASLAIGFTGAMLAGVFWRYETNYDNFWPNAERVYLVAQWRIAKTGLTLTSDQIGVQVAAQIRETVPGVEAVTRLDPATLDLQRGDIVAAESLAWADPNLFKVLRPKALAGDLSVALAAPGSVVLTQSLARKYFGDADPMGQTVLAGPGRDPLRVTAVIEDLPSNSHLQTAGFIAGTSANSPLHDLKNPVLTYILARPGAARATLTGGLDQIAGRLPTGDMFPGRLGTDARNALKLLSVGEIYLKPPGYETNWSMNSMREGSRSMMVLAAVLAGLILAVAAINFITLMTARGAGRAVEVGVRKAAGARRSDLVAQFVGEALVFAVLALAVAFATLELILPLVNRLTGAHLDFNYVDDAGVTAVFVAAGLLLGLLAGVYPAFALSAYRPATVLKGGRPKTPGSARLRQILIAAQFIPLIVLALGALSLGRMLQQGEVTSLRALDPDALLISEPCTPAFKARLASLPGVKLAACAPTGTSSTNNSIRLTLGVYVDARIQSVRGQPAEVDAVQVTPEVLRFHDLEPVAGRMLSDVSEVGEEAVVLSETAARRLGFSSPSNAVGQSIAWSRTEDASPRASTVVGVFADRGGSPDREAFMLYLGPPPPPKEQGVGLLLTGENTEETLAAIDRAWTETGGVGRLDRVFYRDMIEGRSAGTRRSGDILLSIVGVGVLIASLGLYGLSAFLAEQRTKEVGVRKAMGASRLDVLKMLVFQFVRPVLIANLIACPLAFIGVTWLQQGMDVGARVPTGPGIFAPVIVTSLVLAVLATFAHAWRVAGAQPVAALRYE